MERVKEEVGEILKVVALGCKQVSAGNCDRGTRTWAESGLLQARAPRELGEK